MQESATGGSGSQPLGISHMTQHLRETLLEALRGTGRGHFTVRYEIYKSGKFRVHLDGTACRRFYVTAEDVATRLIELRVPDGLGEGALSGLMAHLELTLLKALDTAGFGHFSVWYDRRDERTFQVIVDGTQRHDFLLSAREVVEV